MTAFIERAYRVYFQTPAFLGDADQKAQWRTPPIKALLREWWRIRVAKQFGYDVEKIRAEELSIFGAAADAGSSQQSRLRLRLSQWDSGNFDAKANLDSIKIPTGNFQVSIGSYLAYGPYQKGIGSKALPPGPQAAHRLELRLRTDGLNRTPEEVMGWIDDAVALAHRFGTLGSRSRNGWGSVSLIPYDAASAKPVKWDNVQRQLADCMKEDWPHAIGIDEKGLLVWRTRGSYSDWKAALRDLALARQKINRFGIENPKNPREDGLRLRHMLSYPVTKHDKPGWSNQMRLPSQLRFKVLSNNNSFYGIIVHVPTRCALELPLDPSQQAVIWSKVHGQINSIPTFRRLNPNEIQEF